MFYNEDDIKSAITLGAAIMHSIVEREGELRKPTDLEMRQAFIMFLKYNDKIKAQKLQAKKDERH